MTIAIVIGTHGWAAEQLLKTAEMLLGEQENVGWIDFVPGENAETLIEKYNAQLAKLDTTKGVLFLVDTWGGSPFNAASRIVVDKEHYEVIAGVNIPMLVETLMARDDDPSFDELVALALLTQVAPPGVTAHVVDVAKMIRVYNNPKYAGERVMLLFTNPTDVERLVEGGVKITSVNVGGMAFRQGKTQVNNAVSVDEKDIEAFKKLNARGIELEVRKVSTDPKLKMMDLISKIDK
ncbi:MAG: mannose/fructose/sorbose PTS transporter subunit IIA [Escherichia coli]|nr:mannose/fructose/sorbose PTS transporter subunit IIA [Escherichia coli]